MAAETPAFGIRHVTVVPMRLRPDPADEDDPDDDAVTANADDRRDGSATRRRN